VPHPTGTVDRVSTERGNLRRGLRRGLPRGLLRGFSVVLAVLSFAVFVAVLIKHWGGQGFAFTPRWSAVCAAWTLLTITLLLDGLVRWQNDLAGTATTGKAKEVADQAKQQAVDAARAAQDAGGEPADDTRARAAGQIAVKAAAEHTAAMVRDRRAGLKGLVMGVDGLASTSKLQAALWTYAVLFTLGYMLVLGRAVRGAEPPGTGRYDDALSTYLNAGFRPEYVALLGLPVAGAIAAKAITTGKVIRADIIKPPAATKSGVASGLAEAISDDSGQIDLLDFQYFAFNVVALLYFFIDFATGAATDPTEGFPTIPATLLALSGLSTAAYLTKKQMETGLMPVISSVTPMRVVLGKDHKMLITGEGFLSQGNLINSMFNAVLLDGRPLATVDPWSSTSVTALLPEESDPVKLANLGWAPKANAELVVRDDTGSSSPAITVTLELATTAQGGQPDPPDPPDPPDQPDPPDPPDPPQQDPPAPAPDEPLTRTQPSLLASFLRALKPSSRDVPPAA
jgi:IPT/TIG domain